MGAVLDTDYLIGLGAPDERMLIRVDSEKRMPGNGNGLLDKLAA